MSFWQPLRRDVRDTECLSLWFLFARQFSVAIFSFKGMQGSSTKKQTFGEEDEGSIQLSFLKWVYEPW